MAFLTVVPVPSAALLDDFDLTPALPWFPLVGAAVGALAGGVRVGLHSLLGAGPSTALAMAALVVVTGALHQDALADMCDGLGVRGDRPRRLAVMRDSTLGAFGVLALVLWGLVLFSALDGLGPRHALLALICAGAAGRLAAILHGVVARPARSEGLGSALRVTAAPAGLAAVVAAGVCVVAVGPARGGLALGVAAAVAGLTGLLARATVGGSTGDTLGAAVALAEPAICLALLATWH